LSTGEEEELMAILKKFRKAFGYSMDDLKGISPSIATIESIYYIIKITNNERPRLTKD
jgi:hypothetical protein